MVGCRKIALPLALGTFFGFAALASARQAVAQFNTPATTVQLPTFGVAVDAKGLLRATATADPGRKLWAAKRALALKELPADLHKAAALRFISLRAVLEQLNKAARGGAVDHELQHLGGLTRLQYAFCLPAGGDKRPGDIVLAGPAEPWAADLAGRPIGLHSGRPVLRLQDLAAAIRLFPPGEPGRRPFVGCTIDPDPAALERLQEFQRTIPQAVHVRRRAQVATAVATGTADALGEAAIRVFGVPSETHFAQVMVEADYRMKRIAIGLEPPPVPMPTFASSLKRPPPTLLQRWWFMPALEGMRLSEDRQAIELTEQGVKLSAEAWRLDDAGRLVDSGQPIGRAAQRYAEAFTEKYAQIGVARPVFGELRNIVDLTVAAAVMGSEQWYAKSGLDCSPILSEDQYPIENHHAPRRVTCPVNVYWRGQRMFSLAGGGVQWRPAEVLAKCRPEPWQGPWPDPPTDRWRWR